MALQLLQLGIVFAIGISLTSSQGLVNVPDIDLSIQLDDPKDVTVSKGQSATLKCAARTKGDKPLRYTWMQGDVPVGENDTRRVLKKDGSLHFPHVGGKRGAGVPGEYRCLVKRDKVAVLSEVAKLRVASFDKEFGVEPNDTNVTELQPVVLHCKIHSFPTAQIEWEFNNTPLPHSVRYVPLPSGALLITKTRYADSGSYRCKATNVIVKKFKYSSNAELQILPKIGELIAPTILPLDQPSNVTVLLGDDLNLHCAATGWPVPTVQWRNNDNFIIGNSSFLHIPTVKLEHAGNYTCAAINREGHITKTYNVQVHQVPYFVDTPSSKSYPSASTVRMECESAGYPAPRVYWLKNGLPLALDERTKQQATQLLIRHAIPNDSGIYQCVAVNSAGRIWAAAELLINVSHSPSPPKNIQCRPFDGTSICVTWDAPPNVNVTAYTISIIDQESNPILTRDRYRLIEELDGSTNYSFYVRVFSKAASDKSEVVTCKTGLTGNRSLEIEKKTDTSVLLKWSEISTDLNCNGTKGIYKVQWRREGNKFVNVDKSVNMDYVVTGLDHRFTYEFRISSADYTEDNDEWVKYTLPQPNIYHEFESPLNNVTDLLSSPDQLEGVALTPHSVRLLWVQTSDSVKFYSVCYVEVKQGINCKDGQIVKSSSNETEMVITKLSSNTVYEFKVRSHYFDGKFGLFSNGIEVPMPIAVPSPVVNLKYKVINESTACLHWQAPANKNGILQKYIISYTPDVDWPLDKWLNISVPLIQTRSAECWLENEESVSTYLRILKPDEKYTVLVRAESDIGIGDPTIIIVTTNNKLKDMHVEIRQDQTLGVIIGVILAIICIICCVALLLLRWRCVKQRALERARLADMNRSAVAHYACHGRSVQVRLEDPCYAEAHEVQRLVKNDHSTHIPPVIPAHLDTKGVQEFPNGHINGSAKPYMNGHTPNGFCHITENPQFYAYECNGNGKSTSPDPSNSPRFEEDSNSNVQSSKFYELHRLFENSKKAHPNCFTIQCNPHFSEVSNGHRGSNHEADTSVDTSAENSLNVTQMTSLDDSLVSHRISPILGPNG